MDLLRQRIKANLQRIGSEIAAAAARGGRSGDQVRLVAVTKAVGWDEIAALVALGQTDLGENRAEQLLPRAAEAARQGLEVTWHMIGHLQGRKVRDLLPVTGLVHSVDSLRLAGRIDRRAAAAGLPPAAALLEVNVSGEKQKHGLGPPEVEQVLGRAAALEHLDLRGLMTMAPLVEDAELTRPVFRALRELRDRLNDSAARPRPLTELSMGMSRDYVVAVEEGATIVRIGTAIFA